MLHVLTQLWKFIPGSDVWRPPSKIRGRTVALRHIISYRGTQICKPLFQEMHFLWNIFQTLSLLFSSKAQWPAAVARPLCMQMGSDSISHLANVTKIALLISSGSSPEGLLGVIRAVEPQTKKHKDGSVLEPITSHELALPSYIAMFKEVWTRPWRQTCIVCTHKVTRTTPLQ